MFIHKKISVLFSSFKAQVVLVSIDCSMYTYTTFEGNMTAHHLLVVL